MSRLLGRWRGSLKAVLIVLAFAGGVLWASLPTRGAHSRGVSPAVIRAVARQADAKAAVRRSALEARRNAPGARAARDRSRLAYAGFSDARALRVDGRQGQRLLAGAPYTTASLFHGRRLLRYLSPHVAQALITKTGEHVALSSTLPLYVSSHGHRAAVDLGLVRRRGGFAPRHPIVPVSFATHLQGGVRIGSMAITMPPLPRGSANPAAWAVRAGVAYPNASLDTDFLAKPTPLGAEVGWLLRSKRSPQALPLRLTLPKGAQLTAAGNGAERILAGGQTLAWVLPPTASDADGASVPVTTLLRGSELLLTVPHRHGDWKYPIAVDPSVVDSYGTAASLPGHWSYSVGNPAAFNGSSGTLNGGAGLGMANPNGAAYGTGNWGAWIWHAPGQAHVYQFSASITNTANTSARDGVYAAMFLANPANTALEGSAAIVYNNTSNLNQTVCSSSCSASAGGQGNWAFFQGYAYGSGSSIFQLAATGVSLWVAQSNPPTVTYTGPVDIQGHPSIGWTSDARTLIPFHAHDPGLGVWGYSITTSPFDGGLWNGTVNPYYLQTSPQGNCVGGDIVCSADLDFSTTVGNLPDGIDTVVATADNAANQGGTFWGGSPTVTVKVDTAPPTGRLEAGSGPQHGTITLSGHADDTPAAGASASAGLAGASIQILPPNGASWQTVCDALTPDASGNFSCSWNTASGAYPDGRYQLRAALTDRSSPANIGYTKPLAVSVANGTERINYAYDDLGRLTEASDQAGDTAVYSWDPVGNLTSIQRLASSTASITQVTPNSASAGAIVRINGTGFSTTAGQNTVTFHGALAEVSSSTDTSLIVTVPSAATSGTVAVMSPAGTANSPVPFNVTASQAPSLAAVSPTIASPGSTVTVSGSHIDPNGADDELTIGSTRAATVSLASASAINVAVPGAATSGAIQLDTPNGESSGPDLFVPPPGYSSSNIVSAARIPFGGTRAINISAGGRAAMVIFDGEAGQRMFVNLTNVSSSSSCGLAAQVFDPHNQPLTSKAVICGGSGYVDTRVLPTTGTYAIVISGQGTSTGSLNLTLNKLPPDFTTLITPTASGAVQSIVTSTAGQNAVLPFQGAQGHRLFINSSLWNYTSPVWSYVINPDGTVLKAGYLSSHGSYLDTMTLPQTGTYQIVADPQGTETGGITLTAYDVPPDFSASLTPTASGASVTATTTAVGQNDVVTFQETQGHRLFIDTSAWNYGSANAQFYLLNPDGTVVKSMTITGNAGYLDTTGLSQTGTYTLVVDPDGTVTGSISLTVYDIPPDFSASLTPTASGASVTATTTAPGQNAVMTFQETQGHRLFVNTSAWNYGSASAQVYVKNPDGSLLKSVTMRGGAGYLDTTGLPQTGTYTLVVDPERAVTGSLTLTVYDVPPDFSASLTPTASGASVTATTTAPGQNVVVTFQESQGNRLFIDTSSWNYGSASAQVYMQKPDGTLLKSVTVNGGGIYLDTTGLTQTGTYTLVVDPQGTATGSIALTVYDVPPDYTNATSIGGSPVPVTTTTPGQNALVTFSGPVGKGIHVSASNVTIGSGCCSTVLSIRKPDGSNLTNGSYVGTSGGTIAATLPSAGTYTIVVDPQAAGTGSMTLTLTDPPPVPPRIAFTASVEQAFEGTGIDPITLRVPGPVAPTATATAQATRFEQPTPRARYKRKTPRSLSAADANRRRAHVAQRQTRSAGTSGQQGATRPARAAPSPPAHPRRPASPRGPHHEASNGRTQRRKGQTAPRVASSSLVPASIRRFTPHAPGRWTPGPGTFHGDWRTHRVATPWQQLPALQAPPAGITSLSGQALKLNGLPLAGVTLSIKGTNISTQTDQSGRFLLFGVPAGHRELNVDGSTAGRGDAEYGTFEIGVDLRKGITNTLGYTIWMTQLDDAHAVHVSSPTTREITMTSPRIPGLEIKIPKGSVIKGSDGKPVHQLSVTAVPTDRTPFPLPVGVYFPIYITAQPGGAYLSKGAQIVYPNYSHLAPGQRVPFWNYDPDKRGWFIYGKGTVSQDGKQIVPDPSVRIWEFSGAMISGSLIPPFLKNLFEGLLGADPVSLGSGLFTYRKTDLALPDTIPVALTRTYRPGDNNSYSFGIGTTNSYDLRLWSRSNYQSTELVLPDGSTIDYTRTSAGTGWTDAVYTATGTPTEFYGSTIRWNGSGWTLTRRDGMTYGFGENDAFGLDWIRDRFANQVTISRDAAGNLTQVTSPNGRWLSFQRDTYNRITRATDNAGRVVTYSYDSAGRLQTVTDANGGVTTFSYDASNNMISIEDPAHVAYVSNEYDANHRIVRQTLPTDPATSATYRFDYALSAGGLVSSSTMTDPNGNRTQVDLDTNGYPSSTTLAAGTSLAQTTTYQRQTDTHFLTSLTDPLSRTTAYTYDPLGNVASVTPLYGTPDAETTSYTYDTTYSQPTSVTDPLGHKTTYAYDSLGELTSVKDPLDHTTTLTYGRHDGQPISTTDPLGNTTTSIYRLGDLVAIKDPLGNGARRFVDAAGRVAAVTDPLGNTTRYDYDALNDPLAVTDPEGSLTSFDHDPDGNLTSVTDARGNKTTFGYDRQNRLTGRTDALLRSDSYTYDGRGNLTGWTDRKGQLTRYRYDALGRRTFAGFDATGSPGSESYDSTISYAYDTGNRLTEAADSTAGTLDNSFDPFDRLRSQSGPNGTVDYGYDAAGRRATMTVPGQPEADYSYDAADRLTGISEGGSSVALGYDEADRPTSIRLPDGVREGYSYDPASRLTGITYTFGAAVLGDLNYDYDPAGDRTSVWGSYARTNLPAPLGLASYNADNELTRAGGPTLSYDADGSLTDDGANTYSWNSRGELTGISGQSSSASFAYDPFGRRASKTVDGTTTGFLYDGQNVVQELAGSTPSASLLTGPGLDEVFSRTTAGGTDSYLTDALGSTVALTGPLGGVQTSYSYDPFGQASSSGAPSDNPYQFTGRESDGTGLDYYRARYYSPGGQRFISQDPLGLEAGPNTYNYTEDNPTDLTDPRGTDPGTGVFLGASCVASSLSGRKSVGGTLLCGAGALLAGLIPLPDEELATGSGLAEELGTATERATTVLGHYPEYLQLGEKIGGRTFNVPTRIWEGMSPAEQWAANQKFLDRAIARGDTIRLATPASQAREGSFYERELQYLTSKGYRLSSDGTRLIPGG
jgi:RHS repeat-associated protein